MIEKIKQMIDEYEHIEASATEGIEFYACEVVLDVLDVLLKYAEKQKT